MGDLDFGQVVQAFIVAALLGVCKALWNTSVAFERIKSWAEQHEKLDDLRFAAITKQLEWLQKDMERLNDHETDLRHRGT